MNKINYLQVIQDSQSYTDLDQIILSLRYAMQCYDVKPKPEIPGTIMVEWPSISLEHILKGLENTKERGYNLKPE